MKSIAAVFTLIFVAGCYQHDCHPPQQPQQPVIINQPGPVVPVYPVTPVVPIIPVVPQPPVFVQPPIIVRPQPLFEIHIDPRHHDHCEPDRGHGKKHK